MVPVVRLESPIYSYFSFLYNRRENNFIGQGHGVRMLDAAFRTVYNLFNVDDDSSEWSRRGRTLNYILVSFILFCIFSFAYNYLYDAVYGGDPTDILVTNIIAFTGLITFCFLFFINKKYSVRYAAASLITISIILIFLSDTFQETLWGRNMIPLGLPIILAGLILLPSASIVVSLIIAAVSMLLSVIFNIPINGIGIVIFLMFGIISFLATNHLERVIAKLNQSNRELDQRVIERTNELSEVIGLLKQERARLEVQVAESEALSDKLANLSKTKDEYFAHMSHELRTPLNAIIGYSEGLLEEAELDHGLNRYQCEDINRINRSGRHLLSLINDILDISKLEANQMSLYITRFNIGSVLDTLLITIEPLMRKQQNLFEVDNRCASLPMVGDEQKLLQILLNLLSNAGKFTQNGLVTLRVEVEDKMVTFRVSDSGAGIPDNALDRIFEPFLQVNGAHPSGFASTGLGLPISRKMARQMGGRNFG